MARMVRTCLRAAAVLCGMALVAVPASAVEPPATSTVSVLHAVPAERGGVPLDAYVGRRQVAAGLGPGELASVRVPAGRAVVTLRPAGAPASQAGALTERVALRDGGNATVVAHLAVGGQQAVSVFENDTRTVGMGMGRLTVRHVADAPPIDVRARGRALLRGVRSGDSEDIGLDAGSYALSFARTGTRAAVAPPRTVGITNAPGRQDMGTNVIVYVWGSAEGGPLGHAIQGVRLDLR